MLQPILTNLSCMRLPSNRLLEVVGGVCIGPKFRLMPRRVRISSLNSQLFLARTSPGHLRTRSERASVQNRDYFRVACRVYQEPCETRAALYPDSYLPAIQTNRLLPEPRPPKRNSNRLEDRIGFLNIQVLAFVGLVLADTSFFPVWRSNPLTRLRICFPFRSLSCDSFYRVRSDCIV